MATFKARARALDMLGRQQIAGIPTAISELFKNAHDAYADLAVVDHFREDQLFVLRDDGVGMSRKDFEERWLTLGTESKLGEGGLEPPPVDPSKPLRPTLGEKGIGRLAIAVLGPQVLILSRPRQGPMPTKATAAFVNWRMYELPGINLDEIEVPIVELAAGDLPSAAKVTELVEKVKGNLKGFGKRVDAALADELERELTSFTVDPVELDGQFDRPKLSNSGTGTHFYIQPVDTLLSSLIDSDDQNETASPLTKLLIGFSNTMTPDHETPPLFTSFRDHKTHDSSEELISERTFFSPAEFKAADHHIRGTFNAFGQFRGTISVYGRETRNHEVKWRQGESQTLCGPFTINVAYVQGRLSESRLPPLIYAQMVRKLERVGGLYIYRDGIRVLPYGNNDFDFLDIEKNRSKSAGYYFFSYRRMIGAIEISRKANPLLQEKAGREGFRENRAYVQFKDILKNFFVQIAADFFREGGEKAELFFDRKNELDRLKDARRAREKASRASQHAFEKELESFFEDIKSARPQAEASEITQSAIKDIEEIVAHPKGRDLEGDLSRVQSDTLQKLEKIRTKYSVVKPAGIGLPRQLRRDYEASQLESRRIRSEIVQPAAENLLRTVSNAAKKQGVKVNMIRLMRTDVAATKAATAEERALVAAAAERLLTEISRLAAELERSTEAASKEVEARFRDRFQPRSAEEDSISAYTEFKVGLEMATRPSIEGLKSLHQQIATLHWTRAEDGSFIGLSAMNEALEEDLIGLKERAEADLELTQLGMAVSVISHEFETHVNSIRGTLRRLKPWSDRNPQIRQLYDSLRNSFDHLDAYLTLFTPLQRRLYRRKVEFLGSDITKFIRELFSNRLDRHDITIDATAAFQSHKLFGFPSTFYPVFVNLVDNAIFWLRDHHKPRIIRFDARGNALLISDTGPGISRSDKEAIFELGFTRKPGGRGLGLHISKEVLEREGYALSTAETPELSGATFIIEPR